MRQIVAVQPDDVIFNRGSALYILVRTPEGFGAEDLTRRKGVLCRTGLKANLPVSTINGVIHQREYFFAKHLPEFQR